LEDREHARLRAVAVAALAAAPLLLPQHAHAWEDRGWMPRRHFTSIKEQRTSPSWQARTPVNLLL